MEETRRLLRAAERGALPGTAGGVRDRAIVTVLLLLTGLRIAELAALNTGDVAISARKGVVTVRRGNGDRYRQVPLNAEARDTLDAWLDKRNALPGGDGPALFLSLKGQRLSARDRPRRPPLGRSAAAETSAHRLRHNCLTRLVRPATTSSPSPNSRPLPARDPRRYSLPSEADRQAAMNALTADY